MVAIITNRTDLTSDLGILAFQRHNVPYVRINTEDAVPIIELDGNPRIAIQHQDRFIDLNSLKSIWFRRPRYTPTDVTIPDEHRGFIVEETRYAWNNIYRLLNVPRWVNHPEDNLRAANRLWVLDQAQRVGLRIPPTLVTKNADEARNFVLQHGPTVAKSIGPGYRDDKRGLASFATVFSNPNKMPASLGPAPVLFQRFIPKTFDWRVTVMGQRIYSVRLDSQRTAGAEIDWRQAKEPVPMKHLDLPRTVENSILELLKILRLKFAAIDLVEDGSGQLSFLEVNANGQWGWIEQETGIPISDGLAQLMK